MKSFTKSNQPHIVKSPEDDENLDVWSLPTVESAENIDDTKTNAIGKKAGWRYEPPEEIEVDEVVPLTAEDIEEIRQAAYEEGFNQGKEEGFTKGYDEGKSSGHEEGQKQGHEEGVETGLAEGKEAIDKQGESWRSLIGQLHQPLEDVNQNVEEQLLSLVVELTKAVTHQEVKINPDILTAAITTGIKALPSQEVNTQIILHPDDIKLVEQQFGSDYIQKQGWRLLASPALEHGSCQIENSTSNIDLTITSRLKEVLDSFLQDALHQ